MFRFVDVAAHDSRIRILIETDASDPESLQMICLLKKILDAAQVARAKLKSFRFQQAADARRPALQAASKEQRARVLALYRSIPGRRRERLRSLRKLLIAQGHNVTYDGTVAWIRLALEDERQFRAVRIRELAKEGHSDRKIGRTLGLPSSTVSRLKRNAAGAPTIDDLDSGAQRGAVFLTSRSQGGTAAAG